MKNVEGKNIMNYRTLEDREETVRHLIGKKEACAELGMELGLLMEVTDEEFFEATDLIRIAIKTAMESLEKHRLRCNNFKSLADGVAARVSPGLAQKSIAKIMDQHADLIDEKIKVLAELSSDPLKQKTKQ